MVNEHCFRGKRKSMDLENDTYIPDTQSQNTSAVVDDTVIESQTIQEKSWWGRFHKKQRLRRRLGTKALKNVVRTTEKQDSFDVRGPEFSFGRDPKCNYCLTSDAGIDEKTFSRISKLHFVITKDMLHKDAPIVITDLSRNGTFVNGELIGHGKKCLLRTGDTISIVQANISLFDFEDMTVRSAYDVPAEIQSKYFVTRKIGSGAFGDVYKVLNKHLEPFAVKHIKTGSTISTTTIQTTTNNEIDIMKKLCHPCIIRIIDIIKYQQGGASLILEYMAGGDLLGRIIEHPLKRLTENQARGMFYQIARALSYLHRQGITHRDIKPDNVLLKDFSDDPLVKLSDFGLSKIVTDGTALKSLLGTPNYVAPEILKCNNTTKYSNKVDVWSMGVMLFTMLSGTLPFADEYKDYGDIQNQILTAKFQFMASSWSQVSDDAKSFIRQMIVVDPVQRISVHQMFSTSWLNENHHSIKTATDLLQSEEVLLSKQCSSSLSLISKENIFAMPQPPVKRIRLN